jgi:phosphohistidine phosphatase
MPARREGTCEVYLVRHAIAEVRDPRRFPDDAKRPLTAVGRRKMQRAAQGLAKFGVKVDCIGSSPLLRAVQTAEVLAKEMNYSKPIEMIPALAPGAECGEVIAWLAKHSQNRRVLLVGHEPDLSELLHLSVANAQFHSGFKKGGVALVTFGGRIAPGQGTLVWLVTPKMLRRMA